MVHAFKGLRHGCWLHSLQVYLIQNAFETAALRSLYETHKDASLTNYGWGAEGAAALESALMMMVRVEPRVEPAPIESDPMPALGPGPWSRDENAERLQIAQEIENDRLFAESRARAMHDAHDAHAATTDETPSLKHFVVWGGQYEGVHAIFDTATELQPLIEMPGARAYGSADGVTTRELAEIKLRALQNARDAQRRRDGEVPMVPAVSDQTPRRATASPETVVQGIREVMTYPEARMAIANLSPASPIRDIRRVISAAGMPVSTAVGGRAHYFGSKPGRKVLRSRNRGDILAEARGCLGMTVPPDWALNSGCPISRT